MQIPDNERRARHEVACWPDGTLVRRTVTYGPWERDGAEGKRFRSAVTGTGGWGP